MQARDWQTHGEGSDSNRNSHRRYLSRTIERLVCIWLASLWLLVLPATASAATYAFKTDNYSWETTTNALSWDRACTQYPVDDDKATITFSGGFTFPFAGTSYGSVTVQSNGVLQFSGDTGFHRVYANSALPTSATSASGGCAANVPSKLILVYWTDLNPGASGSGGVTWQQKGATPNRYVVISWNAVYQYGTATPYTFQVILYESGDFKFQYGNDNASGSNATIGVQVSGTDYTQYAYNSGYSANGTAIRWFVPSGAATKMASYAFDEFAYSGAPGEVKDGTGNGLNGRALGAAASTAGGRVCRGVTIPASSTVHAAVDTGVDVDSLLGNSGSLDFWYQSSGAWSTSADGQLLDATTVAGRSFHLVRRSGGTLRFAVSDSAGSTLVADTGAQTFPAGAWVHIGVTWRMAAGSNQSVVRIYVNGTLVGSKTGTTNGSLDPSLGSLYVGDNRNGITSNNATLNTAAGVLDELNVYNYEVSAADLLVDMAGTHTCPLPLHHVELRHASGSGLTCTPSTLTVIACQDSACTIAYSGGVSGTLSATGSSQTVNWPDGQTFTIPSGSSSASWRVQPVTAGSVVFGATATTPLASNGTTCNFGSPSCSFTTADSGLLFDVPNHVSEAAQTVSVTAVKKSDNSAACVPAFASATKSITFACSYTNPSSGTLPLRVDGNALNASNSVGAACDGGGRALNLSFDAGGVASVAVQYADVGQLSVTATYVGGGSDAGLAMTGNDSFIAAPASFAFGAISAAPIKAGSPFSATVTARNSSGNSTPNFGRESPGQTALLSFLRRTPTGTGSSGGSFSGNLGNWTSGSATATNLAWTEVGTGDLTAMLASGSYLGSGLSASGTTGTAGAVGRFIPHHFDTSVTAACGSFTYAGQPFRVTLFARNAAGNTTVNYDGTGALSPSYAKIVMLSDASALGVGSLSGAGVGASAFSLGVAIVNPSYAFTNKATAPQILGIRAFDADAVGSAGYNEGTTSLRSGRLRMANAFGSETRSLSVAVAADYWSGNSWLLNSGDNCTSLPAAAVVRSNVRDATGTATTAWTTTATGTTLSAGQGSITLSAPGAGNTGTLDLALNLGSTTSDQSCQTSHPSSTGASMPWLRSRNGSCAATWDRDPSARATFGIFAPETRKTVHVREIY